MKTSNKLLIIFGLSLILLPILVTAIVSRVYMVEGDRTSVVTENDSFDKPAEGMSSTTLKKAFNKIQVTGGAGLFLYVKLIRDKKHGVKTGKLFQQQITLNVDDQGVLNIRIADKANERAGFVHVLAIYAPAINDVQFNNGGKLDLTAQADSLNLDANNTMSVNVSKDAAIKNLRSSMNGVGGFGFENENTASATIQLKNSQFATRSPYSGTLNIKAEGNSSIDIDGGEETHEPRTINNLIITTVGKTNLKIANMEVKNISGSLSDSTTVQMPAKVLNQMYKKR